MKAALHHHDTTESCMTIYRECLAMVDFLPSILAKSIKREIFWLQIDFKGEVVAF